MQALNSAVSMASIRAGIKVKLFASCREAIGLSTVQIELDDSSPWSLQAVLDALGTMYPALGKSLEEVAIAVNKKYVDRSNPVLLRDGDEVALIPPISGG